MLPRTAHLKELSVVLSHTLGLPRVLSVVLIQSPHPNTQATVVAIEALTRFREAVPFENVQDLRVQISAPKRALNVEWSINHNNAYQQRSAKVRC